jgi:hypothetical protein
VGYYGRGFPPLWDTAEEIFSVVGYNGRGFPLGWDIPENNFRMFHGKFSSFVSNKAEFFFIVSHTGTVFFHCIPQRKRIFCNVSYNAEGSVPLWDKIQKNDTTQNNFFKFKVPLVDKT